MLDQPHQFQRRPVADIGGALLHEGDGALVVDETGLDAPLDRRRTGSGMKRRGELAAFEHPYFRLTAIIWMWTAAAVQRNRLGLPQGLRVAPNYGPNGPCFAGSDLLHAARRFRPALS